MMGYVQIDISDAACFIYDSTKKFMLPSNARFEWRNGIFFLPFEIINLGHLGSFRIMSIIEILATKEQFITFTGRQSYHSLGANMWKPARKLTDHVLTCIHYK